MASFQWPAAFEEYFKKCRNWLEEFNDHLAEGSEDIQLLHEALLDGGAFLYGSAGAVGASHASPVLSSFIENETETQDGKLLDTVLLKVLKFEHEFCDYSESVKKLLNVVVFSSMPPSPSSSASAAPDFSPAVPSASSNIAIPTSPSSAAIQASKRRANLPSRSIARLDAYHDCQIRLHRKNILNGGSNNEAKSDEVSVSSVRCDCVSRRLASSIKHFLDLRPRGERILEFTKAYSALFRSLKSVQDSRFHAAFSQELYNAELLEEDLKKDSDAYVRVLLELNIEIEKLATIQESSSIATVSLSASSSSTSLSRVASSASLSDSDLGMF